MRSCVSSEPPTSRKCSVRVTRCSPSLSSPTPRNPTTSRSIFFGFFSDSLATGRLPSPKKSDNDLNKTIRSRLGVGQLQTLLTLRLAILKKRTFLAVCLEKSRTKRVFERSERERLTGAAYFARRLA